MGAALAFKNEPDYRVVYLKETDFEQRMNDVYLSKQTYKGAPFYFDILSELIDIEALLFLEIVKENPHKYSFTQNEIEEYEQRIVVLEDIEAAITILARADEGFLELFQRDVYNYLMEKQMSFFMGDGYYKEREGALLKNSPTIEVW